MQYLTPAPGYKKTLVLHRREEELRHALRHGEPSSKLAKTAQRVRTARLQRIKALQSALADRHPHDPSPEHQLAELAHEAELWEQRSAQEIIEQYRREKA